MLFYLSIWFEQRALAIAIINIASILFYAIEGSEYLWILTLSITLNYAFGHFIQVSHYKKFFLATGVSFNLILLFCYKYTNFLTNTLYQWLDGAITPTEISLPIGISFYSFTQIAFLVDSYRSKSKHYSVAEYICFVTFFPHLIAGPILIHRHFIPQLRNIKLGIPSLPKVYAAILFFSLGMFKKVIIADSLSPAVGVLFKNSSELSLIEAWGAGLLYTIQLYYDFSAYSEMAVGLALLMNIKIPINFNSPYKSLSIIDFWRRWHISLSFFLKDYLYISLGGNRKGQIRRYFNLFGTMLLGGIWHGAGFTFIVWGCLHGVYLILNHFSRSLKLAIPTPVSWTLTFFSVVIAWIFFRASSLSEATQIIGAMFSLSEGAMQTKVLDGFWTYMSTVPLFILWLIWGPNTEQVSMDIRPRYSIATACSILLVISIVHFDRVSEFIYFQF